MRNKNKMASERREMALAWRRSRNVRLLPLY
jgi:hypothetical protein